MTMVAGATNTAAAARAITTKMTTVALAPANHPAAAVRKVMADGLATPRATRQQRAAAGNTATRETKLGRRQSRPRFFDSKRSLVPHAAILTIVRNLPADYRFHADCVPQWNFAQHVFTHSERRGRYSRRACAGWQSFEAGQSLQEARALIAQADDMFAQPASLPSKPY
jgi:hypothetical protein